MIDETILVVDDDVEIAKLLAQEMLPMLGYKTLVAYDGKTAINIVRSQSVSLMLLDLQLPDVHGFEILHQIKKDGFAIPTIVTTAHGSEHVAVEAFRLGISDYLTKPIDLEELDQAIAHALRESRLAKEKNLLNARLREQITWLKVLSEVGKSLTSTLELDELLRRIVEAGVHITRAQEGFLALLDEESGQLYLRAAKNIDQDKIKTMRMPVSDSIIGKVIQTKRPLRMTQSIDGTPLKVSTGFLVNNLLHVPILSKGNPLGVLSVVNSRGKPSFSDSDEELLTSLADYAAIALENAHLYEQAHIEINERRKIEAALRESQERYELAVRGANDGLWDWDLKNHRIYFSPRWKSLLGYREDEIGDQPDEWFSRIHPEDFDQVKLQISAHLKGLTAHFESEHRIRDKTGLYRWVLTRGLAYRDEKQEVTRLAGSLTDITDRKRSEEKLRHDAFHDPLTGLPNRARFMERLQHAIDLTKRRRDYHFAVLFMDLDHFKNINDSLGHIAGDQLLIAVGKMLVAGLRKTDTIARLGGDEFVILLDDIRDIKVAIRIAEWILKTMKSPFPVMEHEINVTTSIGIVMSSLGYSGPEDILRDADIAMYAAKANGRNRYEVFDPVMRQRIVQRLTLESELRQAIDQKQFRLYYQPILSLENLQPVGFETLIRWRHPDHGLASPAVFLPLAEETGLIVQIDQWVFRETHQRVKVWQRNYPSFAPMFVTVNLSEKHLAKSGLVGFIEQVLAEGGVEPHRLKIEFSESGIIENLEFVMELFSKLKSMGIDILIDHFEASYSSLAYLSKLPIYALKIENALVSLMASQQEQQSVIHDLIRLTHRLGIKVIIKEIETREQLNQVKSLGFRYGQGRLISEPIQAEAVEKLLAKGAGFSLKL